MRHIAEAIAIAVFIGYFIMSNNYEQHLHRQIDSINEQNAVKLGNLAIERDKLQSDLERVQNTLEDREITLKKLVRK